MKCSDLNLILGTNIPIPGTSLLIEQPTIELISMLGEDNFYESMKFCRLTKKNYLQRVKETNPDSYERAVIMDELSIFLEICEVSYGLSQQTEVALSLLFPASEIKIDRQMLLIDNNLISSEQFVFIQETTSKILGLFDQAESVREFNPGNEWAKEIEAKLLKGRERIAKERASSQKGDRQTLAGYISALAVGMKIPVYELKNYTLYQFYDQLKRFNRKEAHDMSLKAKLAGAKDVKDVDWLNSDES